MTKDWAEQKSLFMFAVGQAVLLLLELPKLHSQCHSNESGNLGSNKKIIVSSQRILACSNLRNCVYTKKKLEIEHESSWSK